MSMQVAEHLEMGVIGYYLNRAIVQLTRLEHQLWGLSYDQL